MLKIATGHSEDPDTVIATRDALDMALAHLDGLTPKGALVFAGIDTDLRAMVDTIRTRFPAIELSGCTTDGELSEPEGFLEDSVVITLIASDLVDVTVGMGVGAAGDPDKATAQAVAMARGKTERDPALCIATPEGIGTNIHHILDGLRAALGADFPIVGGAAGDQLRFTRTSQICNDEIVSDAVVVMLLSGPVIYSCGVATGYTPLGQRHVVSRADGAVIHEIGGKPAVELYDDYVQSHSIFFPLAVHSPERGGIVLSTPQHFDRETGSIHLVNPIPAESEVQIATASRDEIIAAAREAGRQAVSSYPGTTPEAALVFSCAGRRAALGTRTNEEYTSLTEIIGQRIPTAGFYTYGEICPPGPEGRSLTHTNALVAVLLGTRTD
jgi:hypothetical protein